MSRIYIFTGKGGVGKTSIAAAHAKKSAGLGKKTLLLSTDMAHNLGDIFEVKCGRDIMTVSENLDILEMDPSYTMEHEYKNIADCLTRMLPAGMDQTMSDFGILPGTEELFSLLKISDLYKEGVYENIMVDCAPTGETLSLLKFPELLSWYMEKLFPIGKLTVHVLAPVTKTVMKVELPNRKAMNEIEQLYLQLFDLQTLLKDREVTSIRLVCVPEKMVVEETKRNYMYMNLFGFYVDSIFVNRVLPQEIDNPFFTTWKEIQKKYMEEITESFSQLRMTVIPWVDEEIKGKKAVERIAGSYLPDDIFHLQECEQREVYQKTEDGYLLQIFLPNVDKSKLELFETDNTVVIRIGNLKRNILLPDSLREYSIGKAKFEGDTLQITLMQQ